LLAILCAGCSYPEFAFSPAADTGAVDSTTVDTSLEDSGAAEAIEETTSDAAETMIETGDAGRCTDSGCAPCPADMIEMPGTDAKHTFCADKNEVTRAKYADFLGTLPKISGQPSVCTWNTTFTPSSWPAAMGTEQWPVTGVDWCDAVAYCKSVGKRLCGKVGGGGNVPTDWTALGDRDEWTRACSNGSTYKFPYGNTYDPLACNGSFNDAGGPVPVGSMTGCKSAFGTFDQSGNISEWEDSCEPADAGASATDDVCQARGGDYLSNETYLRCDHGFGAKRDERRTTIGFRCCAD
jgi:formylglycine-generating enzyme required for sulfatase activity